MAKNKFTEFDMRDEFSFPVYVGYELIEYGGISGIDPNNRFAGQITRKDGVTTLELADYPEKEDYDHHGVVYDQDDKVQTQEDSHDWYATTWDGRLLFVLHKYFFTDASENFANNHFSGVTSNWIVSDYSLVSQFMLQDEVKQAKLSFDHVYSWFGLFRPEQDWNSVESKVINNLSYREQVFSLTIGAQGKRRHTLHSFEQTAYMFITIKFEKEQTREFTYQLSVALRNFFQLVIGKQVGISRIILNRDESVEPIKKIISPKNYRENWFLDQSFLPEAPVEKKHNFNIPYRNIESDFDQIVERYCKDPEMQKFTSTFLMVDQFRIPVDTQIVTLVSAIENYYKNARFSSNHKRIRNALTKLKLLFRLVPDPNHLIISGVHGDITDSEQLMQEMVDIRDYVVHGVKEDKYSSEAELVPDLIAFKRIMRQAMVEVVTLREPSNN